ncbi:MAG TPA: hypothetical protein VFZ34_11990 [Blastocatellia bacterium]|nr:hypothetical protein [Blastocatellia bacterium]
MEHTTFEQVVEMVNSLPTDDRERFNQWFKQQEKLDANSNPKRVSVDEDLAQFKKTQEWLAQNREQFMGQWVCLEGDQLIAHGMDALQVHAQAKAAGIKAPFLEHVVEDDEPFFAGWE